MNANHAWRLLQPLLEALRHFYSVAREFEP